MVHSVRLLSAVLLAQAPSRSTALSRTEPAGAALGTRQKGWRKERDVGREEPSQMSHGANQR